MGDLNEFKDFAKAMVDYVGNYLENIRDRRVLPTVKPGYLRPLIPESAPENPDTWQEVMTDIERVIMPGVTHWHSPKFHAYFPTGNSYPTTVADILSNSIACIGFTWIASPACTELEVVMLDWLGKMLDLPEKFLTTSGTGGGGVIEGSASESTFLALVAAKTDMIKKVQEAHPDWKRSDIVANLVAYCSDQAHSSVERAGLLGGVVMRALPVDNRFRLRGHILDDAIDEDLKKGQIPFYVVATLGTTNCCAFDNLQEIGEVCRKKDIWLHVDAAYAGSSFICPENRYLMKGVDLVDSFNIGPHKWMLVAYDCSCMWLRDLSLLENTLNIDCDPPGIVPEFRNWQIAQGRRFRSLKLWFVLRLLGVKYLQSFIRKHIGLAKEFEQLVRADDRFEVVNDVLMGLVCFRIKDSNEQTEKLLKLINGHGNIHLVPAKIWDIYFIRFVVCSRYSDSADIEYSWNEIKTLADGLIMERDGSCTLA